VSGTAPGSVDRIEDGPRSMMENCTWGWGWGGESRAG
jgi:hypothetical protein